MLRIRKVADATTAANRSAIEAAQKIMREQFPAMPAYDIDKLPEQLANPLKHRFVSRLFVAENARDQTLGRLTFTTSLADLKGCDIVIEAVVEDLEAKKAMWKELDGLCAPHAIFASNTSSLTIASMAEATSRPDRFVGLHFFNPVPLMPLVEVVRTGTTSPETFDRAFAFALALGKEPVAAVDRPGFIVNLLLDLLYTVLDPRLRRA